MKTPGLFFALFSIMCYAQGQTEVFLSPPPPVTVWDIDALGLDLLATPPQTLPDPGVSPLFDNPGVVNPYLYDPVLLTPVLPVVQFNPYVIPQRQPNSLRNNIKIENVINVNPQVDRPSPSMFKSPYKKQ
jgi:hypothetical protein